MQQIGLRVWGDPLRYNANLMTGPMTMELLFLGTSAGIPTLHRNVSALAVRRRASKSWVLIDCGEGTQHQLLRTSLSLATLSAVCITHVHGDHCYGLFGLLASAGMAKRTEPLLIIAPQGVEEMVRTVARCSDWYVSYELHFVDVASLTQAVETEHFYIHATPLSHRVPSYAYVLDEKITKRALDVEKLDAAHIARGSLWQQLQQGHDVQLDDGRHLQAEQYLLPPRPARRVIVGGDNDTPALLSEVAKTAHVLVHEATYSEAVALKVGAFPQHSDAKTVARFAESAQIANLVLTHFSARYGHEAHHTPNVLELAQEAASVYSGNLVLASDFAVFYLDQQGVLHAQKTATDAASMAV
jgi:ribonuclease Z